LLLRKFLGSENLLRRDGFNQKCPSLYEFLVFHGNLLSNDHCKINSAKLALQNLIYLENSQC
jgi:hypothetical protein